MLVGGWTDWIGARMGSGSSVYGGGASSREWSECDDDAGGSAWWRRPMTLIFWGESKQK